MVVMCTSGSVGFGDSNIGARAGVAGDNDDYDDGGGDGDGGDGDDDAR